MAKTLLKRDQVPAEHTWDTRAIFQSDEAWEQAVQEVTQTIGDLQRFGGKLGESAQTLLEALKERDTLINRAEHITVYAGMKLYGDMNNQAALADVGQASSLAARVGAAAAYFEPEILAISPERLQQQVDENEGLRVYRHYFDKLNSRRAHVRSSEVESLMAEAQDVTSSPYQIHSVLEDADMKFASITDEEGAEVEVKQGNVWPLIRSQQREVRKAAWETYADGYLAVKNTMAATLVGGVKRDVFYARARNYKSALEAALAQDNIPTQAYNNVLKAFIEHLPVWHRYWGIKARALGVDKLHGYDIDVPLIRTERHIPYDRAREIVLSGLEPLGEEYGVPLRAGLYEQRWVDIYPNEGKGSGAFSYGAHGTYPFLMMNYDDTLESVSTLAHELGHSMHSYLAWKHQAPVYARYSMFVAETASNFNQAMMRAHLLKTDKDPDFELEVLAEAMSNFHRYMFIMPTLARFELECHERVERGEGLAADSMSSLMSDLFREAYGPSVEVDEERFGITWAQFPHLFGNFYVFQYNTGISAANALADIVLKEGEPAARRYLDFLKAGDAEYPIDALRLAGIDMTTPEPIERAFSILTRMIDRLDELVGEGPLKRET